MDFRHTICRISKLAPVIAVLLAGPSSRAGSNPTALELMQRVEQRAEPARVRAELRFTLGDAEGRTQTREAVAYRLAESGLDKQAIYLTAPRRLAGTALLTWTLAGANQPGDQWLYLPALKRTRRIPATERRQAFMGTDLSLGDMRSLAKVNTADYRFDHAEPLSDKAGQWRISGAPADPATRESLGYGASTWLIDVDRQLVLAAEYSDAQDRPYKRVRFEELTRIDDVWTPQRVVVENLQTGGRTELEFDRIESDANFEATRLSEAGLPRGP